MRFANSSSSIYILIALYISMHTVIPTPSLQPCFCLLKFYQYLWSSLSHAEQLCAAFSKLALV